MSYKYNYYIAFQIHMYIRLLRYMRCIYYECTYIYLYLILINIYSVSQCTFVYITIRVAIVVATAVECHHYRYIIGSREFFR